MLKGLRYLPTYVGDGGNRGYVYPFFLNPPEIKYGGKMIPSLRMEKYESCNTHIRPPTHPGSSCHNYKN